MYERCYKNKADYYLLLERENRLSDVFQMCPSYYAQYKCINAQFRPGMPNTRLHEFNTV